MKKIIKKKIHREEKRDLGTFLSDVSEISKQKIKLAMNGGAVWRKKEGKRGSYSGPE